MIGEDSELADVGEREVLVTMEELPGGLVKLNVKGDIDSSHELSEDELAIGAELFLLVGVGPENHH